MKRNAIAGLLNFWLFLFFAGGIIAAHYFTSFAFYFTFSLLSLILIYAFYKKRKIFLSDIFILLLFSCLGSLWATPYSYYKPERFLNKERTFTLTVVSLPQERFLKNIFLAEVKGIDGLPVKYKVKVYDFTRKMSYLSYYRLQGKLKKTIYRRRTFLSLWIKSHALLNELASPLHKRLVKKSVNFFLGKFKNNLNEEGYRFLSSVFLGRRELLGEEKRYFAQAGLSHLLAISGLHIGLTSLILFFILRLFGITFKAGLIVSVIFLYFYTLLTGASSSTLRAAIMYSLFAASFFVKRKVSPLNSLGLAGLISLIIHPLAVFEVGFQLSFLSVLGIILGFKIFSPKMSKNAIVRYLEYIFLCSIFVTVFITPVVSYYFGRVYLLSIFYNIVIIPFFTLILIINFIFIISFPLGWVAQSIGRTLSLLISLFNWLVGILGGVKGSSLGFFFSPKMIIGYYLVLGAVLALGKYRYQIYKKLS